MIASLETERDEGVVSIKLTPECQEEVAIFALLHKGPPLEVLLDEEGNLWVEPNGND